MVISARRAIGAGADDAYSKLRRAAGEFDALGTSGLNPQNVAKFESSGGKPGEIRRVFYFHFRRTFFCCLSVADRAHVSIFVSNFPAKICRNFEKKFKIFDSERLFCGKLFSNFFFFF